MTTGKSHQNAREIQDQCMMSGIESIRTYLISETYKAESKVLDSAKRMDMPREVRELKKLVAEHRAEVSSDMKIMGDCSSDEIGAIFFSDIEYYSMIMRAYVSMVEDPKSREDRISETFKTVERIARAVDSASLKCLGSAVSEIDKRKTEDMADIKGWFAERQKDCFGIKSITDDFAGLLDETRRLRSDDGALREILSAIAAAMNDALCGSVTRHLACLSVYANARAGLRSDAAYEFRMLIQIYSASDVESLLRIDIPQKQVPVQRMGKTRSVFVQHMLQEIRAFRAFMYSEIREKEESYFAELEENGASQAEIENLKGRSKPIHSDEEQRSVDEAITVALSTAKNKAAFDTIMKEVINADSLRYAAWLITSSFVNEPAKFKELTLKGIDEIRNVVLLKTTENIRNAIEILDGKVDEGRLSEISDWFVKRSGEGFSYRNRASVLDGMLIMGATQGWYLRLSDELAQGWMPIVSEAVAESISGYMLSLEASSNAAAGLEVAALKSLAELKKLDAENAEFYNQHNGIGNAMWN